MRRKVLIVDDNNINRKVLKRILIDSYDVIEAEDGQKAIDVLTEQYETISAVLLDIVMPVMDGYEFLEYVKNDTKFSNIPVIVTTGNALDSDEIKALSMGANDYITKPYNPAIIVHRLYNTIKLREAALLVNSVEKDALTQAYSKEFFYKEAQSIILSDPHNQYDIVCCDVERFKLVNDLFGEKVGDDLLKYVVKCILETSNSSLCGRIGADQFAALVLHRDDYGTTNFENINGKLSKFPITISISVKYGIYVIEDKTIPVSMMCDRAMTACNSIKGKYGINFAYYDDNFRKKLLAEQFVIDGMKGGILNNEFVVYYQPKYDLVTEEIIGAEALVRWLHPVRGFMSPGDFIPLFERNGFITALDTYVWERVCMDMKEWVDKGNKPIPVSVNVSRADIYNPKLADLLVALVEKYEIEISFLHLEITESAYTEDSKQIVLAVAKLRGLGFVIEMDDFGTGYSSLNRLSDLPINIIKLDMRFLYEINDERKMSILRTILFLTEQLSLPVVAEGVETLEQAQLLRELGCEYAQGYYYDKPLPKDEFEIRLKSKLKVTTN